MVNDMKRKKMKLKALRAAHNAGSYIIGYGVSQTDVQDNFWEIIQQIHCEILLEGDAE